MRTKRIGDKIYRDKTYRPKTYHLQNVSATKHIGNKTYRRTKCIGYKTYQRHNVSSTKQIGGQNISADKTCRQIIEKLEVIFKKCFHHF
jgi:hypothetical protein